MIAGLALTGALLLPLANAGGVEAVPDPPDLRRLVAEIDCG